MVKKGRDPDVVTYTVMIDGLCKARNFDNAVGFWREMVGKGLHPDNKACCALVVGLCEGGKVDLAYELVVDLIKFGNIVFSMLLYNSLISGFCRIRRVDT